ncbi:MAG: KH domain-containing protein, partial [Christensenellales bacterium]
KVRKIERDRTVVLELSVAPDDMGRVIGKQGRIAKAIRTVVRSATSDSRKRYTVDIVE